MIPDNVEKIIMTKEDYDRNVEQLLLEKIELSQEIERLYSIIKEVREYIKENMSYIEKGKLEYIPSGEELLEILDKVEENK